MRTAPPPARVSPAAAKPRARRSGFRLTPRGAILVLITMAMLLYMVVPVRTYLAQRDRLGRLERQSALLRQQNSLLEAQVKRLRDPAYLEELARACFGMVKPGEISFVLEPRGAKGTVPSPADCGEPRP